jgi:hypothetical protein
MQHFRAGFEAAEFFRGPVHVIKLRGCRERYTADQIDFVIAYIVPENAWYVFPISAVVPRGQVYIYRAGAHRVDYEKYREAWCQLACPRDAGPGCLLLPRRCERDGSLGACDLRGDPHSPWSP